MEIRALRNKKEAQSEKKDTPKPLLVNKNRPKIVAKNLKRFIDEDMKRIQGLKEVGIHIVKASPPNFMYISTSTAGSFEEIAKNQRTKKINYHIVEDNSSVSSDCDSENEIDLEFF